MVFVCIILLEEICFALQFNRLFCCFLITSRVSLHCVLKHTIYTLNIIGVLRLVFMLYCPVPWKNGGNKKRKIYSCYMIILQEKCITVHYQWDNDRSRKQIHFEQHATITSFTLFFNPSCATLTQRASIIVATAATLGRPLLKNALQVHIP